MSISPGMTLLPVDNGDPDCTDPALLVVSSLFKNEAGTSLQRSHGVNVPNLDLDSVDKSNCFLARPGQQY